MYPYHYLDFKTLKNCWRKSFFEPYLATRIFSFKIEIKVFVNKLKNKKLLILIDYITLMFYYWCLLSENIKNNFNYRLFSVCWNPIHRHLFFIFLFVKIQINPSKVPKMNTVIIYNTVIIIEYHVDRNDDEILAVRYEVLIEL